MEVHNSAVCISRWLPWDLNKTQVCFTVSGLVSVTDSCAAFGVPGGRVLRCTCALCKGVCVSGWLRHTREQASQELLVRRRDGVESGGA